MKNEKWVLTTLSISILLYIVMLGIYIIVDAEMVFNKSITNKKFGYTQYYSKYQYDKLKENKYSLIFGTSRSQKLSSDELNINLLNFHNIYGEPNGILNFLSQLNEIQIKNIDHIYYLVDLVAMRDEPNIINYKSNTFIDKIIHILPLSNLSIKHTLRDLKYNILKNSIYYYIDKDGSFYLNDKNQSAILNKNKKHKASIKSIKKTKSIDTLIKLDRFCKKNKILITYYTPTNSDKMSINVETINFLWAELLNKGIDGFYELYYIDGISNNQLNNNYLNFTDETHLNYNSMNKVFKDIVLDKNSSRFIQNSKELKIYIKALKEQLEQ
jgi:hypothetical protein